MHGNRTGSKDMGPGPCEVNVNGGGQYGVGGRNGSGIMRRERQRNGKEMTWQGSFKLLAQSHNGEKDK